MINVDTVYQTVQALANKEQRGYLTPQEFNLFAIQAQMDIFEQYLYDLDAAREIKPLQRELGDSVQNILHKISQTNGVTISANEDVTGGTNMPAGGRTGRIFVEDTSGNKRTVNKIDNPDQIYDLRASRWHKEGFDEIVYFDDGFERIQVWSGTGQITSGVTCESISGYPGLVYWGYVIVNEKPVYNPGNSKDFDLHLSEQPDVVIKILKLAGVSIEDSALYQAASQEEAQNIQQENK